MTYTNYQSPIPATFKSSSSQHKDRSKDWCQILAYIVKADEHHDQECLPMFRIRFDDGTEIEAFPEELIGEDANRAISNLPNFI